MIGGVFFEDGKEMNIHREQAGSPANQKPDLENQETNGGKQWLLVMMIPTLCFICAIFSSRLYLSNDNFAISMVVCGLYDNVGQCQYLHPFLSRFLFRMSNLIPGADVFMLMGHLLIFLELLWLAARMLRKGTSPLQFAITSAFFILITISVNPFNGNFTVQAASFAATGLYSLLCAQKREGTWKEILIGLLFFSLAMMWRRQAAVLALPYLVLGTAAAIVNGDLQRENRNRVLAALLGCLVLTGFFWQTDAAMNADESHLLAQRYNNSRLKIEDYPTRSWEEICEEADGEITELDYRAARTWTLFDTERMNVERLEKIANLAGTTAFPYTLKGVAGAVLEGARMVRSDRTTAWMGLLLAILSLAGLVTLPKVQKIEILLCDLGTFIILLYFIIIGRAPDRLWWSVLFMPLSHTYTLACTSSINRKSQFAKYAVLICLICGFALTIPRLDLISTPQLAINARRNVDESEYTLMKDSNGIYLVSILFGPEYHLENGKLPSEELMNHMVFIGDWTYGQPYQISYLKRLGIPNPAKALLERDDVFLAHQRPGLVFALLEARAGKPIEAEQIGMVADTPVYRISIAS